MTREGDAASGHGPRAPQGFAADTDPPYGDDRGPDDDAPVDREGRFGVGMPESLKLDMFGEVVFDAFEERAYLVGSATRMRAWRDVDVRVILPDDKFEEMIGPLRRPRCGNGRWNALCLAFAALGREMTGLPIDFQIDQMTDANERYDGPRHALFDHGKVIWNA